MRHTKLKKKKKTAFQLLGRQRELCRKAGVLSKGGIKEASAKTVCTPVIHLCLPAPRLEGL